MTSPDQQLAFDTLAIRAGQQRGIESEHNDPIYATSSFVFANAAEAASRFVDDAPGNVYSRFTNPTVRAFETRLAALEGGAHGIATASGMAAINMLAMAHLRAGDHAVISANVFGSTISLFDRILSRFGIESSFVPLTDPDAWKRSLRPQTRMLLLETPSNPLAEIADLGRLSALARDAGCLLAVDNCLCTPALQRPLELGADVVIHSATKYLDGQGRCVGGALVTGNDDLADACRGYLRTAGPSMSPFNAWVMLNGLETLAVRMRAHGDNAMALARWLMDLPMVERVYYAGLERHPQHALAARQQTGFGGVVSFEVRGGREQAWGVIDGCRMLSITANLGDVKTTITHPATTTHGRLTEEQRRHGGIRQNLIRVAVGLENIEDIKRDLYRGLLAAGKE